MPAEQIRTGAVVAIGDPAVLAGYALAGVRLAVAHTPVEARLAWQGIGADVGLVLLTAAVAPAVDADDGGPLTVVMPG
jgi:vacuolar-type H+-ATPase subunit F/Vma7